MNDHRNFPDLFPTGVGAASQVAERLARRADFRLGTARVRPSVRTIEGPQGTSTVEPRVMQVLLSLADAEGAVLTREDLNRLCWNGVVVGDDSINRAIAAVRRVKRETGADFELETIPRVGYRLKASAYDLPDADRPGAPAPSPDSGRIVSRRTMVAGGLLVVAGGGAFWLSRPDAPDPALRLIEESRVAMRPGTAEAYRQAIDLLEQAVAASPENPVAWGQLALARARVHEHAFVVPGNPSAAVEAAARRALRLDPRNADAKAALAMALPYYGDWLAAERRFDAVLADHPDHLFTRDSRSFFLGAVGRMRESGLERLAMPAEGWQDADLQHRRVYAHWFLGQIAKADQVANQAMDMWPGHFGIWFARLWVLAGTNRFERALAHINEAERRPALPPPMVATLVLAMDAARTREPAKIDLAVDRIMGGVAASVTAVVNGFMLLNLLGAVDRSFDLARAYYLEEGPLIAAMHWRPGQPMVHDHRRRKTNMLFTPIVEPMQRDPRFLPLMGEIGLTDYWRQRRVRPDFLSAARG